MRVAAEVVCFVGWVEDVAGVEGDDGRAFWGGGVERGVLDFHLGDHFLGCSDEGDFVATPLHGVSLRFFN